MEQLEVKELLKAKIPCEETGIEVKTGICGFCGGSTCLVDAYCKDGKVIKVEGNKTLPTGTGRLCVKGNALKQSLYHPDRLLYPMKRIGKRGEGKFERISWDEALTAITEKLTETKEKYEAKQTLIYAGHPKWFRSQLTEFANIYGTPNFGTESSTCAYAVGMANQSVFGPGVFLPMPDLMRCKALCVWGVNVPYSNSIMAGFGFNNALKRGIKLIVVDPRCTPTTERADIHLRPIPGTDGALALGMARVIITALAEKMGFEIGGEEPIHNHEEFLRKSLSLTGLTLEEVKASPKGVKAKRTAPARSSEDILQVKTPTGKIEFVSSVLASCDKEGHEPLPVYHDFRKKLPMEEYPLILTTGSRKPQLFHSRTYRLPWLANLEKYPIVEIHPEDAKALSMEDEEAVILKTPVGSMELTLSINSSCLKGTVNVYHGAGAKDINLLIDDNYLDPISGFPGYKSYCCKLEKKEVSHG